jgi:hypothetical protein
LSIPAKLSLVIQMDSDQYLNDFTAVDFGQLISVAKRPWRRSVTLTFVFLNVSAFHQLNMKDVFQVAKVIQKEAIWGMIDEYLMTTSS